MANYSIILIPDLLDGGFTATVRELPGCISDGDTEDEAIRHIEEAISLRLDSNFVDAKRAI